MLVTYDRYMRDYRTKLLKAKLEREMTRDESEVVPGVRVVQVVRQAVKDSCRGMGGQ